MNSTLNSQAYFQQQRVAGFGFDGGLNSLGVGNGEIITDELNLRGAHEVAPRRPIILIEGVFDGNDRVFRDKVLRNKFENINFNID